MCKLSSHISEEHTAKLTVPRSSAGYELQWSLLCHTSVTLALRAAAARLYRE